MMKLITLRRLVAAGLFCGAGLAALADEAVTFKVDLSRYTNSAGAQVATLVDVRGAFNGWNPGWSLVNDGANVYTNTFTVTGNTLDKFQYKFTYSTVAGITWEADNPPPGDGQPPDEGNNRVLQLIGGDQVLPVVEFYAPSVTPPLDFNPVTFQVDLSRYTNSLGEQAADLVDVRGAFNNWSAGWNLINDGANVYTNTHFVEGDAGTKFQYKFTYTTLAGITWEDNNPPPGDGQPPAEGNNRVLQLVGGSQVLPIVPFYAPSVTPPIDVNITNGAVTFRVDMTPQVLLGSFINGIDEARLAGGFEINWGTGYLLTNNPALNSMESNVYSTTLLLTNSVDAEYFYKFRATSSGVLGWESAAIYGVGQNKDRHFFLTGGEQVLPLVTYNDASLCDYLLQETAVTFVLRLTNGTVDINGHAFVKGTDTIHINGEFLGWDTWTEFLPQLANDPPDSDYYTYTHAFPAGSLRAQKFKFGINGGDNEAPQYLDHIQYIRTTGPTFTMPTSEFGTNYAAIREEKAFGNLTASAPSGGNIPITWLGLPCVTLESSPAVGSGWTDHPSTDGGSSTNWPNTGEQQLFRLKKRPLP